MLLGQLFGGIPMRLSKEQKQQKYIEFVDYVLSHNLSHFITQKRMAEELGVSYKVLRGFVKRINSCYIPS